MVTDVLNCLNTSGRLAVALVVVLTLSFLQESMTSTVPKSKTHVQKIACFIMFLLLVLDAGILPNLR